MCSNDKLLQIYFVQHDFSGLLLRVFLSVLLTGWLVRETIGKQKQWPKHLGHQIASVQSSDQLHQTSTQIIGKMS